MTHHEKQLRAAFQRSGLALLGFTFARAMDVPAIRTCLEMAVKARNASQPAAPHQPSLL